MKNRQTLIIEGSSDRLEKILALFEAGELNGTPELKVLDIGIIATDRVAIEPVDLYRVWLDSLWSKGFQPVVRSTQATSTNKKTVRFQNISVEIVMTIVPLADTAEIQIFLQIRPTDGKGYLPVDLQATIFDDLDDIILQKSTRDRFNLLDLTEDGDLVCQLADSFKLNLTLGDENIEENFPS